MDIPERKAHRVNPAVRQRANAKQTARRKARLAAGLCTGCGGDNPTPKYRMCPSCRAQARKYKEAEMRRKGRYPQSTFAYFGKCSKCGKYPPKAGYKLCERCYASAVAALDKTPTHNGRKNKGYFADEHEMYWQAVKAGAGQKVR